MAAGGYWWNANNVDAMDCRAAEAVLHKSKSEVEKTQACVVVANEAMRLIDALKEAAVGDSESAQQARRILGRLVQTMEKH